MKILQLVASVGPRSGGLGPVAVGLSKEQSVLGHSPTIWTLNNGEESIESLFIWSFPTFGPRIFGYSPQMERKAVSRLGRDYDLLHQHGIWLAITRTTNRWRSMHMRPTVVAPHGTLEEYALKRSNWKKQLALFAYEKLNLRNATCLHATAQSEAISFRKFGLTNPIAVIPNGIPAEMLQTKGNAERFRSRFALPPASRQMLFFSRLHPTKGLPLLFEALARLPSQLNEWSLVVAGYEDTSGYQRQLRETAAELGLMDRIRFAGPVFGPDRDDMFAASDLFILPTHSENFGIVIAEALAHGVPVITTKHTPWEELVQYRCGWWVEDNADAIRGALEVALRLPPDELAIMGMRGKALVEEKYIWSFVAQKTIRLYDWLLGKSELPEFVIKD